MRRAAQCADRFFHDCPDSGACEEGPAYFGLAGGAFIDLADMADAAVYGETGLFDDEKLRRMAAYIRKAHIGGQYFVNFADAPARLASVPALTLGRMARRVRDSELLSFAGEAARAGAACAPEGGGYYLCWRLLRDLFDAPAPEGDARTPGDALNWFADSQILTARRGRLFFAAKGGHNGEPHNHNDVGSFLLYLDGQPLLIDAGSQTYSRDTFSDKRYTLWHTQSGHHSTLRVNGAEQQNGARFCAARANLREEGDRAALTMDIAPAYPEEAMAVSCVRAFTLDKNGLNVTDEVLLKAPGLAQAVVMLAEAPRIAGREIRVGGLTVTGFDGWQAQTEALPIEDGELKESWRRPALYRLTFTSPARAARHRLSLTFAPAPPTPDERK